MNGWEERRKDGWMDLEIYFHVCLFLYVFSTQTKKLSVFLGKNAINETDIQKEQEFSVSELIIHEHFDNTDGNFNNDIGNTDYYACPGWFMLVIAKFMTNGSSETG